MDRLDLRIDGMSCSACEGRIERALAQVEGVIQSAASHVTGHVAILFDPRQASAAALRARVEHAGSQVRP